MASQQQQQQQHQQFQQQQYCSGVDTIPSPIISPHYSLLLQQQHQSHQYHSMATSPPPPPPPLSLSSSSTTQTPILDVCTNNTFHQSFSSSHSNSFHSTSTNFVSPTPTIINNNNNSIIMGNGYLNNSNINNDVDNMIGIGIDRNDGVDDYGQHDVVIGNGIAGNLRNHLINCNMIIGGGGGGGVGVGVNNGGTCNNYIQKQQQHRVIHHQQQQQYLQQQQHIQSTLTPLSPPLSLSNYPGTVQYHTTRNIGGQHNLMAPPPPKGPRHPPAYSVAAQMARLHRLGRAHSHEGVTSTVLGNTGGGNIIGSGGNVVIETRPGSGNGTGYYHPESGDDDDDEDAQVSAV